MLDLYGNDSADVAPCILHMRVTKKYFLALSTVEHCLTISFYFCICGVIAQTLQKNVYWGNNFKKSCLPEKML